jgi:hypothetical protein
VNFFAAVEVDAVDLVDDIPEQITIDHPVDRALEHGCNYVPAVATITPLQIFEISKQARTLGPIRSNGFFLVGESDQFITSDAVFLSPRSSVAGPRLSNK